MSSNRIQKLLFSEYSDFEDVILVESPFAETSRHGKGIRQVQIGLTPTKLILASYYVEALDSVETPRFGRDPDIESFELVSAYPVECVNLSVFRHRRRQTLKARFCDGKVLYFEIGGWQERKMLWSVWCERIKFLSPYETRTSVSETSVASSSSSSSLYIVRSSLSVSLTGQPTLWCHYGSSQTNNQSSWEDPHLYLGPSFFEKGINFLTLPEIGKINKHRQSKTYCKKRYSSQKKLILSPKHELIAQQAVELWESQKRLFSRIHRRYGFCPYPALLGGLGLSYLSKPQTFSIQIKRTVSMVHLPADRDVDLVSGLPKAMLLRTVSQEALSVPALCPDKLFQLANNRPSRGSVEFWVPDRGDQLKWEQTHYKRQQRHLRTLRKGPKQEHLEPKKKKSKKLHNNATQSAVKKCRTISRSDSTTRRSHSGGGDSCSFDGMWKGPKDRFTSSGLAHQLTMLDKQLFLQLSTLELGRLRKDASSLRTPCLRALVCFSQRVTCLVVNQIVAGPDVKTRAVLIVKFVGVAFKCHRLHNLQSTVSVLRGLQSPPVYRLHRSWAYARRHHASKYRRFEDLSKRYLDPRLPLYQKTYDNLTATPPYLPCVSLLTATLLRRLTELPRLKSSRFFSECSSSCVATSSAAPSSLPKSLRRFLSAFSIYPPPKNEPPLLSSCQSDTHLHALSKETLLENLDKFFAPVSVSCPTRRHLQDVEYFLETNQTAASRYAIPINTRVRSFLLQSQHDTMERLFSVSKQIEPLPASE